MIPGKDVHVAESYVTYLYFVDFCVICDFTEYLYLLSLDELEDVDDPKPLSIENPVSCSSARGNAEAELTKKIN